MKPRDPLPPPPQMLPPAIIEIACLCGQLLKIPREAIKYKCACPGCRRRFFITMTEDKKTGEQIAAPMYVTDTRSGDTYIIEPQAPPPNPPPPPKPPDPVAQTVATHAVSIDDLGEGFPPDPPSSMYAICLCGKKLLVKKEAYDKRVRCPYCNERLILSLDYDPSAKTFDIRVVRVPGEPTGDTKPLGEI